jgi:trimeric autotransporter adhesin
MKQNIFSIAILAAALCAFSAKAQNTFPAAGNVGIGTLAPGTPLEVRKDQNLETVLNINNQFAGVNAKARLQLTTVTASSYVLQELQDFSGSPGYLFATGSAVRGAFYQAKEFYFQNLSGTTALKITATTGIVSIGTLPSTPGTYKLFVEGGILTEKVKVAVKTSADWADYVFDKNYRLLPLGQVEQFIQQHRHLPGIASAEEMVKEGNDLGKTDARLLAKIEELTLYVIELNKKAEKLETENQQMKQTISSLQKQ